MQPATATEPITEPRAGLTLTAGQILSSQVAFIQLLNEKPIGKPRLAYNLTRTWKDYQEQFKTLSEQRLEILKSHGAAENGDQVTLAPEKQTLEFKAEMEEFWQMPITLWGHRLTLEELEAAQINLSPATMIALDWLIGE